MSKRIIPALLALIIIFTFASCSKSTYPCPDLPWDAEAFEITDYMVATGLYYSSIKWGTRVYIPYGEIQGELKEGDLTDCLGYTMYNKEADKNNRVFTLRGDDRHFYLLILNVDKNSKAVPVVYKSVDSIYVSSIIYTPEFVKRGDYSFWNQYEGN